MQYLSSHRQGSIVHSFSLSPSHRSVMTEIPLTLKVPITTAADDIHSFHCFLEKIRLDVSSESSARQRIHRKHQALFP